MNGEGDRPLGGNAEAEWARLAGTIRLSAGFWLGFVFSPSAEDAVALRLRAERRLIEDARGLSVITCERPQALLEALPALLLDDALAAAGCVWVDGVRADPPGVEDGPWTRGWIELFLRANERRDLLRRRLAGGLVFAATPAIKPRVREAAPDLWSVRTLVLELAPVRPAGPSVRAWTPPALLVGRDRSAPDPGFALAEAARRAAKGDDVSRGLALVQATAGLLAEGLAAEARSAAQRAAGLLRDASPIDASRALALLAEAELAVGDATQGDAHIQQAVTIRSERDRDLVPIEWHDLAATAALARHAPERARASYALALATARERAGSIGSAEGLRELAVLLEKRAAMERDLGELAAARVDLEEAIRLRRRHRELTDDRRATRELAGTLDGAADAYRRLGEGALFDAASTEAAALREGLEEPAKQPADEPARVHPSWTAELGPYRAFLSRVEKVASLRDPDAKITPRSASAPFAGVLEVAVPTRGGAVVELSIVGAVEQPVTEALLDQYIANVEHTYRRESPSLGSTLVHGGPPAPVDLVRLAQRRGVTLQSFGEYQGLLDFDRYLEWQTRALEGDQVHPPWLYVEQPARWSLPDGREETTTEHALATLLELLESPHPRFALVLGDFGAGKTFLLHELARRMARDNHPQVPVLVEMSRLEKQRDLRALLAQHFAQAGMGRFDPAAFQYMLAEGKIALLFDGFDELALRLTYDRAVEHFDTVLMAAQGNAKVVVTSRTQHFLNDQQVRLSLAKRAENVPGFRLMRLETFGEKQIRRFLGNLIPNPTEAEERYKLLDEVKDLLGLSENPRMLGFIARIEPGELLEARARSGEITAAKLYELLIGRWLDFEHARANPPGAPRGISRARLGELVKTLAGVFWARNAKSLGVDELRAVLVVDGLEPAVVEHMVGSGSLLVRDAAGRFGFVHRSVVEWLVADTAAREVRAGGDAAALAQDEMSELMADFFITLAGREVAKRWAHGRGLRADESAARKNAARVLRRVVVLAGEASGESAGAMDLEGQDLRGQDCSSIDLHGANLARADLRSATLQGADLRGASLLSAKLGQANLDLANLSASDLTGADLAFARLMGTDLRDARGLVAGQLRGAKLVGAHGVELALEGVLAVGAAPPVPRGIEPMWASSSRCRAVAWGQPGDLVASAHDDGTVLLWSALSGKAIRAFSGHVGAVRGLSFSPDGQTLASGADDRTVRLWDVATARVLRACEGHTAPVRSIAFSPDGRTVVSGSDDRTVRLWDVATAHPRRTYEAHTGSVRCVAFSPDGRTVVSGSDDRTIRAWEVASTRPSCTYEGHTGPVSSVAFSPDGRALVSGSDDHTARIWSITSTQPLRTLGAHDGPVLSVAFSPDGRTVASGSHDSTVRLWDVASDRPQDTGIPHTTWVAAVAFSPDGGSLASGSPDGAVRLWDVARLRLLHTCKGHRGLIQSVAFTPDGVAFTSASHDHAIRLWSPQGEILASGSDDRTVRLWGVPDGRVHRTCAGHENSVQSVALAPDGRTLASASLDGTVRLCEVATARCLAILLPCAEGWAAFTPDGRYKIGGDIAGAFWHVIGLCRFEPGELDPYIPGLRVPDDEPFVALPAGSSP